MIWVAAITVVTIIGINCGIATWLYRRDKPPAARFTRSAQDVAPPEAAEPTCAVTAWVMTTELMNMSTGERTLHVTADDHSASWQVVGMLRTAAETVAP